MQELGLEQMDNDDELEGMIKEVLIANPNQVDQYKGGKTTLIQFFIGQTMAKTRGKANPQKVSEILNKLLNS